MKAPSALDWEPNPPADGSPEEWLAWANAIGISRELGLVSIAVEPGTVTSVVEGPPRFPIPNGAAHGGLLLALIDQCMGLAVVSAVEPGLLPATANLATQFLRPAQTPLTLVATVTSRRRSFAFVEVRVEAGDGRLCATAQGTMAIVTAESVLG